ncbi:MAG: hypothetical protein LBF04_02185 [Prevotellaceae bacterium]|jgi:hypothetical protein|nr:hypothetical protein [Prevotellaceae bacterium]
MIDMYNMLDTYELVLVLCGLNPNDDDDFNDSDKVDEILYEKYGIEDTNGLNRLIKDLTHFVGVGQSSLTGKNYKGFCRKNEWLYKIEIERKI